jgi:hypothetical protein
VPRILGESLVTRVLCNDMPANHRTWTINDSSNSQRYHKTIKLAASPCYVKLRWRLHSGSTVFELGCFRFDLEGLLKENYVRVERPGLYDHEVRLRLQRGFDNAVYLQVRRDSPRLFVSSLPHSALELLSQHGSSLGSNPGQCEGEDP